MRGILRGLRPIDLPEPLQLISSLGAMLRISLRRSRADWPIVRRGRADLPARRDPPRGRLMYGEAVSIAGLHRTLADAHRGPRRTSRP